MFAAENSKSVAAEYDRAQPVRSSALATSLHGYAQRFQIRARAQRCTNARAQALDARMHIRSIADIDDQAQVHSIAEAQ